MRKVAVLQSGAARGDKAANLEKMRRAAHAAGAMDADVLVLPELFLTGYNLGSLAHELAEDREGPSLMMMSSIARQEACALVAGFPERHGETVFNSAVAFDASGNQVALYRKMHLFGSDETALFSRGQGTVTFELAGCKVGLAICYDIEFPEFCRALRQEGAEIILAPTANMVPYWEVPTTFVRARALENAVVVAYANHCGTEAGMRFTGLSGIVAADGRDVARAGRDSEVLLVAEMPSPSDLQSQSTQIEDLDLRGVDRTA